MNLRKNLIDILNRISNDETLLRLLYYPVDPLNTSKLDVKSLSDFSAIKKERIFLSPKTNDLNDKAICRVCMYMGNRDNTQNKKVALQDVVFDVYAHIDQYDKNDARALWICDRINEILHDEWITGVGKMESYRSLIIPNAPSGYIGYRMIFTFGSVK
ncbi:Uncharacterised protein [[Flavobacterium] thermophilum]|nr:Uncharacterised protein [[Flavobacterium] thermophilum]